MRRRGAFRLVREPRERGARADVSAPIAQQYATFLDNVGAGRPTWRAGRPELRFSSTKQPIGALSDALGEDRQLLGKITDRTALDRLFRSMRQDEREFARFMAACGEQFFRDRRLLQRIVRSGAE